MELKAKDTSLSEKRSRLILRIIGLATFTIGLIAAFLGPAEIYCFYLFSEGGIFHYEGFRFGSFMFGNLAAQIMGYYFIAAVLIPIGYGTVKLKSWARHLTLAVLRFWVVGGIPLIFAFLFVLLASKELSLLVVVITSLLLLAAYFLLPWFANRFYESQKTRLIFKPEEIGGTWIEKTPIPILGLSYIFSFFILVLHTQIFFNGIFPLFGIWITGLQGIIAISISFLLLSFILWGMIQAKVWAWRGMLVYFCMMSFSYIITLLRSSWNEILAVLNLPTFELELLQGIPLQGYHFALFIAFPFLLTIWLIIRARTYYKITGINYDKE
jgi:hypothetical protein